MSEFRNLLLACSALATITLPSTAHAALDDGLRGSIVSDQTARPNTGPSSHGDKFSTRPLGFAAAREDENSVMYLAAPSTSTSYSKSAIQIAQSMGFLGQVNGAGVIIGIVDTGIQLDHPQFMTASGASRVLPGTCLPGFSSTLCSSADNKLGGDDLVWPTVTHGTHVAGIA